ncbi:MAG: pilin [Patescibacteria group bacterium]
MFKKISVIIAVAFTVFISSPVIAATDNTSQIPELNPFCWHRKDCQDIRKQFGGTGTGDDGFITDVSVVPCTGGGVKGSPEEWGRCLPAGQTKTEISFGGQDKFSNIGEFIVLMYKYLLTIASIVAVVMIIIAGMQWVTSGGNSEAISSAKKRIGGAVIGLFIAYMSYFVLNTINPALVNLRLPQVWLIRPQALMTEFCSDLKGVNEGKLRLSYVSLATEPTKPLPPLDQRDFEVWSPDLLSCGSRFLAENGGDSTCIGNMCLQKFEDGEQKTCFDKKGDGNYECGNIKMAGKITYSGGITEPGFIASLGQLVFNRWDNQPVRDRTLYFVCNEKGDERWDNFYLGTGTGSADRGDSSKYYLSTSNKNIDEAVKKCLDHSGIKGIVLQADMMTSIGDLEGHFIGRNAIDLGDGPIIASSEGKNGFFLSNYDKIDSKYFFTPDELKKGVRMNMDAGNILQVHGNNDKVQAAYRQRYLGQ